MRSPKPSQKRRPKPFPFSALMLHRGGELVLVADHEDVPPSDGA